MTNSWLVNIPEMFSYISPETSVINALESCFYTHSNNRRVTLEQMEETVKKAMEGLE